MGLSIMSVSNEAPLVFQDSVNLVNSWGEAILPTGRTLSQVLTIGDISLWKIIEVELAMYKVPKVISSSVRTPSIIKIIRPYLGNAKQKIIDFIKIRASIKDCDSWPNDQVILFLGFMESFYSNILAPIANSFSKEKDLKIVVLNEKVLFKHWGLEVKNTLVKLNQKYKASMKELNFHSTLSAIISYKDSSLWPQMLDVFTWFFKQRIPKLLPQIAVAKHILETHRPALIVSPDVADPRTRIYHLLCKKFSIPTLDIQQGLILPDSVEYQFFQADHVAAVGQYSRNIMLAHGVLDRQITITGSPGHDGLDRTTTNEQEKIRLRFGLPLEKRIILFAATYYMSGFPNVKALGTLMTEAIFAAADQSSGVCLVVKPHPVFSQQIKELKSQAGGRCNIIFTDPKDNTQELIKACDAFVTFGSTSTLDALISNKLTITPSFPGWWSANDQFAESGATLVPRTLEEIAQIFQTVANGSFQKTLIQLEPARARFLENWIYKADGQASLRVCNLIKEMIKYRIINSSII